MTSSVFLWETPLNARRCHVTIWQVQWKPISIACWIRWNRHCVFWKAIISKGWNLVLIEYLLSTQWNGPSDEIQLIVGTSKNSLTGDFSCLSTLHIKNRTAHPKNGSAPWQDVSATKSCKPGLASIGR